jgi:PhnB protein
MTTAVDPVPPHYAAAIPYLVVPDAAAALAFYKQAFGAIELYRLTAPNAASAHVVHAELRIGAATIMLGSAVPKMNIHPAAHFGGTPVFVSVHVEDVDRFVAHAINAGCTLERPVETQFYGDRTAAVTDPFGLRWMFQTHIEDVTPAEMQTRMEALMAARG